jgi:cytochrome c5
VIRLLPLATVLLLCGCDRGPDRATAPEVTLRSASIALPADTEALPDGPHADLVTARCTACHSAGMILTQPALSKAQWQATVTKMREVYKAPVPVGEDAAIIAYLTGLSRLKDAPSPAQAGAQSR